MTIIPSADGVLLAQTLLGLVLPIVVGLITTRTTSARVKTVLLALVTAIATVATAFVESAQAGQAFDVKATIISAVWTLVVAIATHFGVWKPLGVSSAAQAVRGTTIVNRSRLDGE